MRLSAGFLAGLGRSATWLPQVCSDRDFGAFVEADRAPLACGAADATAIAPSLVNDRLLGGGAVGESAELAHAHTFSTTDTYLGVNCGNVFGSKHDLDGMGNGEPHRKTVRPVAVTDAANERRVECPDGMAETFGLVIVQCNHRIRCAEYLQSAGIRSVEKTFVQTAQQFGDLAAVRSEADAVAVTFLSAQGDMATDAGDTDNGIGEPEDSFDLLDGHDLPEMDLLHPASDEAADHVLYESRCLVEIADTLNISRDRIGVCKEVLNEPPSSDVAQQVVGIVLCLQIPLLSFTVFHTEVTHMFALSE